LEPGLSPATRKSVLPETDEITRPPAAVMRSVASSRVRSGSVPVSTKLRPASGPSPGAAPTLSNCSPWVRRSAMSSRIAGSWSWRWINSATIGPTPGVAAMSSGLASSSASIERNCWASAWPVT
jgi:hypothetical protein